MRRAALVLGALALLFASPASAKWFKLSVDENGFSPRALTVRVGDSVRWTNTGDSDHRVTCPTCRFTSNVLKPDGSYAYSFFRAGTFTIVDPMNGNKTEKVVVKPALYSLTVAASPTAIPYGAHATIAGNVSSHRAGQQVEILAQRCLEPSINVIARRTTKKNGAYSFTARPTEKMSYFTRFRSPAGLIMSGTALVDVKPIVTLKRLSGGDFVVRVTASKPFVGKRVTLQKFSQKRKRWVTLQRPVLRSRTVVKAPRPGSITSSRRFSSRLGHGERVRAYFGRIPGVTCYAQATSSTIDS